MPVPSQNSGSVGPGESKLLFGAYKKKNANILHKSGMNPLSLMLKTQKSVRNYLLGHQKLCPHAEIL